MRLTREFGVRNLEHKDMNDIIFFVFEGQKTDLIYFNGIHDNKVELNIKDKIKIVPIFRSYIERRWSNPQKILNQLLIKMVWYLKHL